MPTVTREDLDALNTILTVSFPKSEYKPEVDKKLKEYRKKSNFKGFRPGQAPIQFIRRRFGNNILADTLNESLRKQVDEYIKEQDIKYLGQPIPIHDDNQTIDINKMTDYTFKFELGLAPEFDVKGLSLDNKLPYYDIEVAPDVVEAEVENIRKRYASGFEEDVLDIEEEDMISIDLVELEEDGEIKEGGVTREDAAILVRDIRNDQLREDILTATVGDVFDANVYELDRAEPDKVRKYLLNLTGRQEINPMFRMTIKSVRRLKKAELGEELYKSMFPNEEIADEDAFNERIRQEIYKSYKGSAQQYFQTKLREHLTAENKLDLPDAFLQKWLKMTRNIEDAELAEGYADFAANVCWTLVRSKLVEQYNIEVTAQDVEHEARMRVARYYRYQFSPYSETVTNVVKNIMNNEREVQGMYEELLDNATLAKASEDMGKDLKNVTREEFEQMIADENKEEVAQSEETVTEE